MRTFAILTTLALVVAFAPPTMAQDNQDKTNQDKTNRGGLGGVLDTLGNVLGAGTQKLHGTVVVSEGSTFVLRTDDKRTYRVDTASLDPQKISTLTPGHTVSVTTRGGGQAGVLTATEVTPDTKNTAKTFQSVNGTVQEAERQRVLFKTRDGLVVPVDVGSINGLPYLAANQPATLYYEQGSRQEIVGVWIQPGTSASAQSSGASESRSGGSTSAPSSDADRASPSARSSPPPTGAQSSPSATGVQSSPPPNGAQSSPSASVSSDAQSVEGVVQSLGISELTLQTAHGSSMTVDTSGIDRQTLRGIAPGDTVTVTGTAGTSADRFVAQSVQPRS